MKSGSTERIIILQRLVFVALVSRNLPPVGGYMVVAVMVLCVPLRLPRGVFTADVSASAAVIRPAGMFLYHPPNLA